MHPEPDEADVLALLEVRLERLSGAMKRLKDSNCELTSALEGARAERDRAVAEAQQERARAAAASDELGALRTRQQQAFTRVKALVAQIEQLEAGGEA